MMIQTKITVKSLKRITPEEIEQIRDFIRDLAKDKNIQEVYCIQSTRFD